MSVKRIFTVPVVPIQGDFALLLLRLVLGSAFILHGLAKLHAPFSWMGPNGFAPAPFQALAAIAEFGGGLGLILGFIMPIATLGLLCTMAVATWSLAVLMKWPFIGPQSFELPAAHFCACAVLLAVGPGRLSLDRIVFGKR